MSFYGRPRFSGGGQVFPSNQSNIPLQAAAPLMQQMLQVELELKKNFPFQNRTNNPNQNTKNMKSEPKSQINMNKKEPNKNFSQASSQNDKSANLPQQQNNSEKNVNNLPLQNNQRQNSNSNLSPNNKTSKNNSNVTNIKTERDKPVENTNLSPAPLMATPVGLNQFTKSDSKDSGQNFNARQNHGTAQMNNNQFDKSNKFGRSYNQQNMNSPNFSDSKGTNSSRPGMFSNSGRDFKGKNFFGPDKVKEKAIHMFSGSQIDLPPLDMSEKKFNNYSKLFVGNIAKNTTQEELTELFKEFGEISSVYLNKDSSFAFVQYDYKTNASKAMREVDNKSFKGRNLKVRFATISEGIRIKNLSPYVSNELLERAFSLFGNVESARILCDDRGLSKGEGVVIFKDKKSAVLATKKCQEECFFLSGALRPAIVSSLDLSDESLEGLSEATLPRNDEYYSERQIGPHFAESTSFEFDFGNQWKQLYSMYEEKKSALESDFKMELGRLEKKMVLAKVEYETDKLRKELAEREAQSAELRRVFERRDVGGPPSAGHTGGVNYDSYGGTKRPPPVDPGYDTAYNAPYDQYSDSYDRGVYPPPPPPPTASTYGDRPYDHGYVDYGREDYRSRDGSGAYGQHDRYDRSVEYPSAERPPVFDPQVDQSAYGGSLPPPPNPLGPYSTDPPPYASSNKRPRY